MITTRLALYSLVVLAVILSASSVTYAQTYSATITLDQIPSTVTQGSIVTFSGTLMTSDGKYVIPGKTVYIKDDIPFWPDTFIATITTDANGKFSVTWTATLKDNGKDYHFYAVFEGDSQVYQARSQEYQVSVVPQTSSNQGSGGGSSGSSYYYSTLVLDSIPSVVNQDDTITFSGTLMTSDGKYIIPGRTTYIKDNIPFAPDTFIATVVTDSNGKFSATWNAIPKSGGGDYHFYATFEGDTQVQNSRSQEYAVTVLAKSTPNPNQGSSSSSSGNSNYFPTEIVVNQIPSSIYANSDIQFSGRLTTNGQPLSNALIYIKKDIPLLPDEVLVYGNTDSNGQFLIHWTAEPGEILKNFGVYAIFEGGGNYAKVRSNDQYLTVLKYVPQITLNPFPTSANVGDVLTFSGTLQLGGADLGDNVVYIMDEVPLLPDNLLATAYVNANGEFSTSWVVQQLHSNGLAHIYAVFEGDQAHSRVTTCDVGVPPIIGGCLNTIVLRISETNPPPPPPPPQPQPQLPPTTEKLNGDEYIKLYYSLPLSSNPVVAISPTPESYDQVQRYVTPVEDGIRMWTNDLQQKFGGNWNVDFEVLGKDLPHFNKKPDIIVNIVTKNEEQGCIQDFGGVARLQYSPIKPVNIEVCAENLGQFNSDLFVSAASAHEFIHAMGVGHAFNKEGDLMCSYEIAQQGKRFDSCPNLQSNHASQPSDFDLAAVAKIYGTDGFALPNNVISNGDRFTANDYQNQNYGTITNPTQQSENPTTQDQTINIPNWVRQNALWWSEGQVNDNEFVTAIQYLIQQKIIYFPMASNGNSGNTNIHIPSWIKSNAKLWAAGEITDQDFVKGLQYLISSGVIKV